MPAGQSFQEHKAIVPELAKKHREAQGIDKHEFGLAVGYKPEHRPGFKKVVTSYAQNFESGRTDGKISLLFKLAELLGPDFVDDLADALFAAAKQGLKGRRDDELRKAQQVIQEAAEQRDRHLKAAAILGDRARTAQRKPAPSFIEEIEEAHG